MNKGMKYIAAIILVIAIIIAAYLIIFNQSKKVEENANPTNNPTNSSETGEQNAQTPAPVVNPVMEKIPLEFMSDNEKKAMGINQNLKIQVVERGTDGTVLGYKIIKQDSDILTEYAK